MAENQSVDSSDPNKKTSLRNSGGRIRRTVQTFEAGKQDSCEDICDIVKSHLKKKAQVVIDLGGGTGVQVRFATEFVSTASI